MLKDVLGVFESSVLNLKEIKIKVVDVFMNVFIKNLGY